MSAASHELHRCEGPSLFGFSFGSLPQENPDFFDAERVGVTISGVSALLSPSNGVFTSSKPTRSRRSRYLWGYGLADHV